MSIIEKILADKRLEVESRSKALPIEVLRARAKDAPAPRSLEDALTPRASTGRNAELIVIAEVKKASPSKGLIREDFDGIAIARAYERGGARAISVLTDEKYFQGRLELLTAVRREVSLPVLRKDFIIDPYQVWEARAAGADAVLLIAAALPDRALMARLSSEAAGLGMDVLWEVHDGEELSRVLPLEPRIVGINNRNLSTFEVSLETTRSLVPRVPGGTITVSESGFFMRSELEDMRGWGVGAFLIGESLMRAPDPGEALARLVFPGKEAAP